MSERDDRNAAIIAEFRANAGHVGGPFETVRLVLVHHVGRTSGTERVNPMAYLRLDDDPDTIYVFASMAGAPKNPDWYYNLVAAGRARVEVGTDTYDVTVTDLEGDERTRLFDEQKRRVPGFAEYEKKVEGIRTIPVLALARA